MAPEANTDERSRERERLEEVAHAAARGAVGAMAMSGMRSLTVSLGLVEQTPPQAIVRQRARGILKRIPRRRRQAAIALLHFGYGAVGGAGFGVLPDAIRRRAWAGPAYGLAAWVGFAGGLSPLLGLRESKTPRPAERLAIAADHLLYGLVLSEGRRRPQE